MEEGGFTDEELETMRVAAQKNRRIKNWVFGVGIILQGAFWAYYFTH